MVRVAQPIRFTVLAIIRAAAAADSLQTVLGDDASASDKLVISGGTASWHDRHEHHQSRRRRRRLTTQNGILVVQAVNGATTGSAFSLRQYPLQLAPTNMSCLRAVYQRERPRTGICVQRSTMVQQLHQSRSTTIRPSCQFRRKLSRLHRPQRLHLRPKHRRTVQALSSRPYWQVMQRPLLRRLRRRRQPPMLPSTRQRALSLHLLCRLLSTAKSRRDAR